MAHIAVCLKVSRVQGQNALAVASKMGLVDKMLAIAKEGGDLCIPLVRQPSDAELQTLQSQVPQFKLVTAAFSQKKPPQQTLIQALETQLPPHLLASLPQALDVIGDIAIIEIPPELKPHQTLIGNAILSTHKNLKTVLAKAGAIGGTYRIREYSFIAGEPKTQTVHREYGCQYHVDLAKAYFSPRLGHEHWRVASLVGGGEVVADLFAGVGPFAVLIGKQNAAVKIYAVDLNPDAVELLKINVRVNRVDNRVFPVLGDARQVAATSLRGVADRVIMNLPESAIEFVDAACLALKPAGGVVHFYGFIRAPDTVEVLQRRFCGAVEAAGRHVAEFAYARGIRETAPFECQVVLDAKTR